MDRQATALQAELTAELYSPNQVLWKLRMWSRDGAVAKDRRQTSSNRSMFAPACRPALFSLKFKAVRRSGFAARRAAHSATRPNHRA